MASFSQSFIGSTSSAGASVRDAIQSYRRAQYLVAGSTVAASDASEFDGNDDEESRLHAEVFFDDEQNVLRTRPSLASIREDAFIGQLSWDDEDEANVPFRAALSSTPITISRPTPQPRSYSPRRPGPQTPPNVRETTPLLGKRISFTTPPRPVRQIEHLAPPDDHHALAVRRASTTSIASSKAPAPTRHFGGRSTFGQTLFNSIAILLGIGMLSEPLAFAYAGWIGGTALIISYGFVACYTAKILAHIILEDSRVRSYSDIGRKAFGPRATSIISVMFCLELFAVSVILVTLYGDSLHSLIPAYSSNTYKAWGIVFLLPTVFLPLSLLSYTSILGIISTVLMIVVIIIDGFTKTTAPGSLWDPAKTSLDIWDARHLGLAFGLFMAGFSGHAVIPSLARDMQDPSQFDQMINWAFIVATCVYTMIGYAGYLMFGNDVSDEISMDLLRTPGYNPTLNQICLWMLVVSPLSKFGLNTQPLNAALEVLLGIDTPISSPEEVSSKLDSLDVAPQNSHFGMKHVLGIVQRVALTCFAIYVSINVPEFSSMMAFLGSFSAFMLSIVGPVLAKIAIRKEWSWFDAAIILVGTVMALWGTGAAFVSAA